MLHQTDGTTIEQLCKLGYAVGETVLCNLYSRGMHPVARVIKLQNKTLIRNNQ
jgi:hypothetical protein